MARFHIDFKILSMLPRWCWRRQASRGHLPGANELCSLAKVFERGELVGRRALLLFDELDVMFHEGVLRCARVAKKYSRRKLTRFTRWPAKCW